MIIISDEGKIKFNVLTIQINTNIFKENLFGEKTIVWLVYTFPENQSPIRPVWSITCPSQATETPLWIRMYKKYSWKVKYFEWFAIDVEKTQYSLTYLPKRKRIDMKKNELFYWK